MLPTTCKCRVIGTWLPVNGRKPAVISEKAMLGLKENLLKIFKF
jgi:hypothetical protein